MPRLVTDAVVLHAFDYLETSRILRLVTREAGVQSVIARGARRSPRRFGSALDLFAGGVAEIQTAPGRDLQTLVTFDVSRARLELAADLARFAAATVVAELALRFVPGDAGQGLHDTIVHALDAIAAASPAAAADAALAGAWRVVGELGFAPSLDDCASCRSGIGAVDVVAFSHRLGGVLCGRCAAGHRPTRRLPNQARTLLRRWVGGLAGAADSQPSRRAHQRLLREFLREHLDDRQPLRAFEMWERAAWSEP